MSTELLVSQRDDFGEVGATEVPSFNFKKAGSGEGEVCLGSRFLFPSGFQLQVSQWDGSAPRGSLALSHLGSSRWGLPQPLLASCPLTVATKPANFSEIVFLRFITGSWHCTKVLLLLENCKDFIITSLKSILVLQKQEKRT